MHGICDGAYSAPALLPDLFTSLPSSCLHFSAISIQQVVIAKLSLPVSHFNAAAMDGRQLSKDLSQIDEYGLPYEHGLKSPRPDTPIGSVPINSACVDVSHFRDPSNASVEQLHSNSTSVGSVGDLAPSLSDSSFSINSLLNPATPTDIFLDSIGSIDGSRSVNDLIVSHQTDNFHGVNDDLVGFDGGEADDMNDADSAFDDNSSETYSLNDKVLRYTVENGRRYHSSDQRARPYFLPNDDIEQDRLDLFNEIFLRVCEGRLHYAPLEQPHKILDLGTGTGIWANDMGDKYPSAQVTGIDISPIQPSFVSPNTRFEVDDIENEWTFHSQFDYIHCRYLAGSVRDWPRLMQQVYKYTKPGGWVEFQDFDMDWISQSTDISGTWAVKWTQYIVEGVRRFGTEPEPGPKLDGWVRQAGFVNLNSFTRQIPCGTWPKDTHWKRVGALNLSQFSDGLDSISLRVFRRGLGWSEEEVSCMLGYVRRDLHNKAYQLKHNL